MSNNIKTCIQSANKYLIYLLLIFLFVHFTIIIPFKHSVKNYEIGEADKSIEDQLGLLNKKVLSLKLKIDTVNKFQIRIIEIVKHFNDSLQRISHLSIGMLPSNSDSTRKIKEAFITKLGDSVGILEEELYVQQAKKFQYQKEKVDLVKQKADRSFTIPILGISINESVILLAYPAFILFGLCLTLYYRKRFFDLYVNLQNREKKGIEPPIWTTPIPYCYKEEQSGLWYTRNILGLSIHFLLLYILYDFTAFFLKIYAGRKIDDEIIAINIMVAIIALIVYTYTIINTYRIECNKTIS